MDALPRLAVNDSMLLHQLALLQHLSSLVASSSVLDGALSADKLTLNRMAEALACEVMRYGDASYVFKFARQSKQLVRHALCRSPHPHHSANSF